MAQKIVKWISPPPSSCDLCGRDIAQDKIFVDGKTDRGHWAIMCSDCHKDRGYGLGTGKGQKYQKQPNGDWIKTEG